MHGDGDGHDHGTEYGAENRYTLLDVRFSRNFQFGRTRVQPRIDVYNVLNSDAVNTLRTTYATTNTMAAAYRGVWRTDGEVGVQIDF